MKSSICVKRIRLSYFIAEVLDAYKNSICAPTCREARRVVPRVPNAHNLFATGSSGLRKILALDSISNGVGIQKLLAFSSTNIF